MPKQRFFRCAFLFLPLVLFQTAHSQSIKLGIQGGLLLANMNFDPHNKDSPDFKNQAAFQIAIPLEIGIGKMFAIQPEIMYGLHGNRVDEKIDEINGGYRSLGYKKASLKMPCLEIPLLAKIKFGSKAFEFYMLAGPSLGWNLSGEQKDEYAYQNTTPIGVLSSRGSYTRQVIFVKKGYNVDAINTARFPVAQMNFNAHFGAGFDLKMGDISILLEGRYILGLTDLFPDYEDILDVYRVYAQSRRIGLSVGVMFSL